MIPVSPLGAFFIVVVTIAFSVTTLAPRSLLGSLTVMPRTLMAVSVLSFIAVISAMVMAGGMAMVGFSIFAMMSFATAASVPFLARLF